MAVQRTPAQRIALWGAAVAIAAPLTIASEGWMLKTSPDPVGIPTACAGVTHGVVAGKTYTDEQCVRMTATAMIDEGLGVDHCLTANITTETRAAILDFVYNLGGGNFCSSTLVKLANAGDLKGACREINESATGKPQWIYAARGRLANGKPNYIVLPGLVRRRAAERAMCELGLTAKVSS